MMERVAALYAFVFSEEGHLQLSFYFDGEDDAEVAYEVLRSANCDPASLADKVYPVAFVAETTPDIIPYLLANPGSQLERRGRKFVPV